MLSCVCRCRCSCACVFFCVCFCLLYLHACVLWDVVCDVVWRVCVLFACVCECVLRLKSVCVLCLWSIGWCCMACRLFVCFCVFHVSVCFVRDLLCGVA